MADPRLPAADAARKLFGELQLSGLLEAWTDSMDLLHRDSGLTFPRSAEDCEKLYLRSHAAVVTAATKADRREAIVAVMEAAGWWAFCERYPQSESPNGA